MTDDADRVVPIRAKKDPKDTRHPSKGPGKGAGWGGPAKGPGRGPEALRPDGRTRETIEAKRVREETLAAEMRDKIAAIARDPTVRPETQLTAAVAMLNRIEGTPQATNVTVNLTNELTPEQRQTEIDKLLVKRNAAQ